MSLKGTKRGAGVRGEDAGASKRRRAEPEDALWQLRPVSDLKMSSIYNRSASEAPAELFRKDLISAMKLPDSEPLTSSEYWVITDTWKQDWERGVQVPVNPDALPAPKVKIINNPLPPDFQEFKLPRDKYIHLTRDSHYSAEKHLLSTTPARAEAACSYDLDATDTAWLKLLNAERARAGAAPITEDQLEKVIEELEVRTWDKIQAIIKSEEGLGIEYDENVICDVCRSPDSEDGNEMVFCDSCNICVHQACYGITVIPDGQWMCRPCGDGVRPTCVLCPNLGGAMKCTPSGHKWAHVSCVLWIPEVSIGCAEKMEPITKISSIPASRWSLVCVLCRERKGACIQCSVKTCKTAYHVTCAFKHGLEMRAIIEDENADDGVKLRSYCQKHSVNSKKEKGPGSGSEEEEVKRKRRKDMTSEEKTQARAARLQEIEREFDRHVSVKDISTNLLDIDQDAINYIYNYWKLKRRAGHNRPLLPPKSDDNELLTHRQEQADLDKMRQFVQLRQDLERVRNLCYMVSRREKLSRSFFRMREQTFHKQVGVLALEPEIAGVELQAILQANHGPSIYDRLYSHPNAPDNKDEFDEMLARIAPPDSGDEKKKDRNGMVKGGKSSNPYRKHYVNGSRRSGSMYSGLSSEESGGEISRNTRYRGRAIGSSTDDEAKKSGASPKKKISPKTKGKRSPKKTERTKKKKTPQSKAVVESSSEEDTIKTRMRKDSTRSKTLQQLEKEMASAKRGQPASDSDDLIPMKSSRNNSKFPIDIYSDSSDENTKLSPAKADKSKNRDKKAKSDKSKVSKSPNETDSQQSLPRTKAAMKEFVPPQAEKKAAVKDGEKPAPKKRGRKPSNKEKKPPVKTSATAHVESDYEAKNKENIKKSKQKEHPTDLIVPQRQAAKKASENMRSTTVAKKDEPSSDKQVSGDDAKSKPKLPKPKEKETKDVVPAKVGRKKSSKETGKEKIAYVPQRQAAKKAAAHIKSIGSKAPVVESESEKKKENDKSDAGKSSPKKEETKSSKPVDKESSSSSSSSGSSSYSSSSSSEEELEKPEKHEMKPTAKAREIKPLQRPPSMFSPPPAPRPTVDLPFLDKVSRPLSSTSASSDSESSRSQYSGSSPTPKRPRRRRKRKDTSTDAAPSKALDKKLKTSERGTECGVPSPPAEGEEPSRADSRLATRARTRSTASSGNMPNKSDAGPRKPSKDDADDTPEPNRTPKESSQPGKLPTPERKEDAEPNKDEKEPVAAKPAKGKRLSVSVDEKDKTKPADTLMSPPKASPKKSAEPKKLTPNRRMSVKEPAKETPPPVAEEPRQITPKARRLSRYESTTPVPERLSLSPVKTPLMSIERANKTATEKKSPPRISDDHWLPEPPSPYVHPPPVEKPGGHEKYMTEDKALDADLTDKTSVKMIAKIQANLNENTMIKSPKTPMDARSMDILDVENPMVRNRRKRSLLESDKKFIAQDASHVQGVEISKSAKIPSAVNTFPNSDMFELDMLGVDEFNHDDIMKPFASYEFGFLKEDSKEQGVQETLNLVDRLRMQLSTKKIPLETPASDEPIIVNDDKEEQPVEENNGASNSMSSEHETPTDQSVPLDLHGKTTPVNDTPAENHVHDDDEEPTNLSSRELVNDNKDDRSVPMTSNDKWSEIPMAHTEAHLDLSMDRRKYDHDRFGEEGRKEPITVQTDMMSNSQGGESISLSKQSDDSQHLSLDHSAPNEDQDPTREVQPYDNNNSLVHDSISSPYIGLEKWRESKITTRRSSASSTNSEASVCSRKGLHMSCDVRPPPLPVLPDLDPYPPLPVYPCPVEPPMSLSQYAAYATDATPFLQTMASLPLFGPSAPLSLPSPSPLYAAGLPFGPAPLPLQPLPKPSFSTLCAAFTSSSQNIALTTAMIAPPTPKPMDSPSRDDIDVTTHSDKFPLHVPPSPTISVDSYNDASNTGQGGFSKLSNDSNDTIVTQNSQEPKSPGKPAKFPRLPGKSPGKSPAGISPKQTETKGTKRSSNRSNRSNRGRGRSKSRGQTFDYVGNSIQSKLVGTVYDFNEELANDGVDLKALRDRRKSIDVRDDKKSEHSQSPRVASSPSSKKPATTVTSVTSGGSPGSPGSPGFPVAPLLPGPVDMRTYQPLEGGAAPPQRDTYNSHLLASFASGTAEPLAAFDEESERQLQSELLACNPGRETPPPEPPPPPLPYSTPVQTFTPHVSLSDSRNQLKVKIKGPFRDPNYCTSSAPAPAPAAPVSFGVEPGPPHRRMRKKELLRQYWTQDDPEAAAAAGVFLPPPAPAPIPRTIITIPKAVASMTSIPTREDYNIADTPPVEKKKRKTTSGLSRELRHLEVSMNDDVDTSDDIRLSTLAGPSTQAAQKRRGRASTKPPKTPAAVPTATVTASTSTEPVTASTSTGTVTTPVTPKLKIKLGCNSVPQVVPEEPAEGPQLRPPKKRHLPPIIPKPSFEDLRRESMKYRRLVMADFEGDDEDREDDDDDEERKPEKPKKPQKPKKPEKSKKSKPGKSEKRKRKKEKKAEKLRVVNSPSESATKLVIKIKRTKEEEDRDAGAGPSNAPVAGPSGAAAAAPEPSIEDPFKYDPMAVDPLTLDSPSYAEASSAMRKVRTAKVTPIRLKLARSSEGYVMKDTGEDSDDSAAGSALAPASASATASATRDAPDSPVASTSASASAVNKHCEVR